jgi:glycosyltransferase involved in cell wall biosynthesis
MIRVLHVVTDSYSAFAFVAPIIKHAETEGMTSTMVCSGRKYADAHPFVAQIRALGIDVRDLEIAREAFAPVKDVRALFNLVRMLHGGEYDLVHTRLSKAGTVGRIAARIARVPAVHTVDDFAFVEASGVRRAVYLGLERAMSLLTEHTMFVSENERRIAVEHRIGRPGRQTVIGHGVDLELFDPARIDGRRLADLRRRHGIDEGRPVVGGVARLVPRKGWETWLAAVPGVLDEYPDAQFLVVGGGPLESRLRGLASDLGIGDRVSFTGFVDDQQEMPYFFAMMDIFCVPSIREGFGMVFAEAGAMGKPVVAGDIAPVNEIVRDGETGVLVPPGDHVAVGAAMRRLLADPAGARAMGELGRRRVRAEFDLSTRHHRVTEVYRRVLADPSRHRTRRHRERATTGQEVDGR